MKRRKLLHHLEKHGCEFLRKGGKGTLNTIFRAIFSKTGRIKDESDIFILSITMSCLPDSVNYIFYL